MCNDTIEAQCVSKPKYNRGPAKKLRCQEERTSLGASSSAMRPARFWPLGSCQSQSTVFQGSRVQS